MNLKQKLGLPINKKIILYAPTWRDSSDGGSSYTMKPPINIEYWEKMLGKEYILLMRTHQYTNKLMGVEFNDFCRDFCSYPIVNDLIKASDLMISDYSAIIQDFSILEKPILCFAYDFEDFRDSRGLYLDYDKDMPSGILRTEQDVINYIVGMDYNEECQKTTRLIKNKIAVYGGNATKTCIDKLFEK